MAKGRQPDGPLLLSRGDRRPLVPPETRKFLAASPGTNSQREKLDGVPPKAIVGFSWVL